MSYRGLKTLIRAEINIIYILFFKGILDETKKKKKLWFFYKKKIQFRISFLSFYFQRSVIIVFRWIFFFSLFPCNPLPQRFFLQIAFFSQLFSNQNKIRFEITSFFSPFIK